MQFIKATKDDLPEIYEQIQSNFIIDEYRDFDDILRVFGNNYHIEHIVVDGTKVGFMGLWQVNDYTFLEHFAIYEPFRSSGLGGQALELLKERAKKILLEAEPPIEPIAIRRVDFYLRHGMLLNKQDYFQPPYRTNGNACYLKLMSYPETLIDFDNVAAMVYKIVYGIDYEKRKYFRNNSN